MQLCPRWSEKYATGIHRIDEQNRQIFTLLKELDAALLARSAEQVQDVVIDLLDYAATCIQAEERHVANSSYPLAAEHCQAHTAFRKRAEDYIRHLADGENPIHLGHLIRNDLNLWITHHIAEEDKDYAEHMLRPATARKSGFRLAWLYG